MKFSLPRELSLFSDKWKARLTNFIHRLFVPWVAVMTLFGGIGAITMAISPVRLREQNTRARSTARPRVRNAYHDPEGEDVMKVAMLVYAFYERDTRVLRYAESLAKRGHRVDVIALNDGTQPAHSRLRGVEVYRLQHRRYNETGLISYLVRTLTFFFRSTAFITARSARERYDLVHIHNIPDFLVFAAWLPRITGGKLIHDIHDLVPEFFATKFGRSRPASIRLLRFVERLSCCFAHHVILGNELWKERIEKRSLPQGRCTTMINYVDAELFHARERTRRDDRIIILYPGGLQFHQGVDIAIRAFAIIQREFPSSEFHIYGEGGEEEALHKLAYDLNLNGSVRLLKPVDLDRVAELMANADVGVVPKRADGFGDEAYSTKILEYMAQGLPVVASRTRIDTHYFCPEVIEFFKPGCPESMAAALRHVLSDPKRRDELRRNGRDLACRESWQARESEYFDLVHRLVGKV